MKKGIIFIILLILVLVAIFSFWKDGKMENENTDNIIIENNTIQLNSLTLRQKLAQMIMIRGDSKDNIELTDLAVGGIFLDKQESEEAYSGLILKYQKNSKVKLLVATDLEGTWNPFQEFKEFPKNKDVENEAEAFQMGKEQGALLKSFGFNMNFAPVSEFEDDIYGGRAFSGDKEEIKSKLKAYIEGLQENVHGTCKHYPGRGMIKNLHYRGNKQTIDKEDLELFSYCFGSDISAIMVGHQIVNGELNSQGKPASVSEEVIGTIPNNVLVVSDEVNMRGLKNVYIFNKRKMYRDLINSGENLILDFKLDKKSVYKLLVNLEEDVKEGKIKEEKVDGSVRKILKLKGYEVR